MIRIARFAKVAVWGIVLLLGTGSAQAITINGDNFDIVYTDLSDFGLYGLPSFSGNTVLFTPNNFSAESLDGAGTVSTNVNADFQIIPHTGFAIDSLFLIERGFYLLNGAGSTVTHSGDLSLLELGGGFGFGFDTIDEITAPMTINDNALHLWQATAEYDILNDPFFSGEFGVAVSFSNDLVATTTAGISRAFIEKRFNNGVVMLGVNEIPADPVPLPAAVWLFGSGLLGLFGVARRRRRMQ